MSLQQVLQQLLQSAKTFTQPEQLSQQTDKKGGSTMKGFAGGALSGGALALLLGNKKFRKMGGKVAVYGGVAALGAVAYRAYGEWKNNESAAQAQPQVATPIATAPAQLAPPQLEQQSRLILAAMVSAAKADGHINAQEQELLDAEFAKLQASPADMQWLNAQLQGPADPVVIAKQATTPEEKAEVYLVSVLVTEADSFMEKAYLDELARQLNLEPGLKEHLEKTALEITV